MSKQTSAPIVLSVNEWNVSDIKYMQPKLNAVGGKAISLINTKTNRSLHISTSMLMTWGINDWTDEKTGESNGKYSITLNFPSPDYKTEPTTALLDKLEAFTNQILDDAVKNSEIWWGEPMSREVLKHTFFPFLKYSKDKVTKKIDLSKGPSFSPKVPLYGDKWSVEIYNTNRELLFPNQSNSLLTPMDFVPKKSRVACVLQCGGIWIGGKGWGVTWKLVQCVVKPPEVISVFGTCHIPDEVCSSIAKQTAPSAVEQDEDDNEEPESQVVDTAVEDSDEEDDVPVAVVEEAPKKKIVKKLAPAAEAVPEPVAAAVEEPPKKKIVKKKV
jgi:hypothetical protein